MKTEKSERRRTMLWALPASLVLHALITAFLVYGLPVPAQQPQEEEPVNVALVPPPEPPKPEPPPPPKPEAQKQPEPKVEKPVAEKPPALEVLKPVFQFGDKDTGPRKSLDGASAQDNSPTPVKDKDTKPPGEPKDVESKPAASPDSGEPAGTTKTEEKPATAASEPTQEKQATEDASKQGADKQEPQDADKQAAATPLATPGDDGEIELPASAQAPKARPENAPKRSPAKVSKPGGGGARKPSSTEVASAGAYSGLPGVRELFSHGATGNAFGTTATDGMSRGERVATLCANVLAEELKGAEFSPEWLPMRPLKSGNIVIDPDAAFRATIGWYHVSFRCEVDTDATRVLSFDSRVGSAASPAESAQLEQELRRQNSGG
ncbi:MULTISPECIES: DUF930 domain-containing protein [unclassified Mesorhizobium]|uniref:DUF930 domain-containing protein n=1 Tax=unclassified Mesorhizobium TaxID=325217 RepID=UPI0033350121